MQLRRDLGTRGPLLGVADSTFYAQVNPYLPGTGWDVIFKPDDLDLPTDGEIEVYHIAIDGPIGSSLIVLRDGKEWDYASQGWANGWDPQQPLILFSGHFLQLCWNFGFTNPPYNRTTNIQPRATLWLRRAGELL